MGDMRNVYSVLVRRPEERNHQENLGIDGRIVLRWILREAGLRIRISGGLL
jgi:hypothetical protein